MQELSQLGINSGIINILVIKKVMILTSLHYKPLKKMVKPESDTPQIADFKPSKRLGQVFLKDMAYLEIMLKAGMVSKDDYVIEVGPGSGVLTEALAKTRAEVVTIEKDKRLISYLTEKFNSYPNVKIIQADIRDLFKLDDSGRSYIPYNIPGRAYKVIANIPYYLTSYILRLFLECSNQPELMVLMVQKEVADRIISQPPKSNLLSIVIQYYADVKMVEIVPKQAFSPKPTIDSAIIQIKPLKSNYDKAEREAFLKTVKAGFSQPRKILISNLKNQLKIDRKILSKIFRELRLLENSRGQDLKLSDWQNLAQRLLHLP